MVTARVRAIGRQLYAKCKKCFDTYPDAIYPLAVREGLTSYFAGLFGPSFRTTLQAGRMLSSSQVFFQLAVVKGERFVAYAIYEDGKVARMSESGILTPIERETQLTSAQKWLDDFLPITQYPFGYMQDKVATAVLLCREDGVILPHVPPGSTVPKELRSKTLASFWADVQNQVIVPLTEDFSKGRFWELALPPALTIRHDDQDLIEGLLSYFVWQGESHRLPPSATFVYAATDTAPLLQPLSVTEQYRYGAEKSNELRLILRTLEAKRQILTS